MEGNNLITGESQRPSSADASQGEHQIPNTVSTIYSKDHEDNFKIRPQSSQSHHDDETSVVNIDEDNLEDFLTESDPTTTADDASPQPSQRFPKPLHKCRNIDEKKVKLRTSKDIYDRLKWDAESIQIKSPESDTLETLDVSSIYVGYKDRFLGMCEIHLEEFTPGGDIPFHRLYYFRTGGPAVDPFVGEEGEVKVREDNLPINAVFLWDRDSRTDIIFNSGNSSMD